MPLEWLFQKMQQWPDRAAVVWRDQPTTYRLLLEAVAAWHERLDLEQVGAGEVIAIVGDYSPGTMALMLALLSRGAIVVPLSKTETVRRADLLETAQVERLFDFDDTDTSVYRRLEWVATAPLLRQLADRGAPGLVLFTSGSTGKSKALVHSVDPLLDQFRAPRRPFVTLTFLLFDHMGGINTLFRTISSGGTMVLSNSRGPDDICQAIERHRVDLLPVSPTFLTMLILSESYRRYDLSSLRVITYGTEMMPESTLRRVRELFPAVSLQQTYGMSEFGVLRSRSRDSDSTWLKIGGSRDQVKVVDGTLRVRAPTAMLGYLNAPDPFDADGWLDTGDLVEVDGEYLRFLGRRSDLINVGGNKVFPAEVEDVLLQVPNVRDATVYGEPNPITGRILVAEVSVYQPESEADLIRRIRDFCRPRLARFKVPVRIRLTDGPAHTTRYKKMRPKDGSDAHAETARSVG